MQLKPENHTLILAPMADLTHGGVRRLIEHYGGCDLYYSEMIDCRMYLENGPLERFYEDTAPDPSRLIYQLVGSSTPDLVASAKVLGQFNPAGIDVNMGCSAPHILQKGAGCAMMNTPQKAAEAIKMIRDALPPEISVSAKLRLGEKEDRQTLLDFAHGLEEAGADFITLHPKIRKDKAARHPKREYIGLLQQELSIPVVANGHIWSWESYLSCWEKQQPGGSMIGRQAIRQPWFFSVLKRNLAHLGNEESQEIKRETITVNLEECWDLFYQGLVKYQPKEFHKSRSKRFSLYFSENLRFKHKLHFSEVTKANSAKEVDKLYKKYFASHQEECLRVIS